MASKLFHRLTLNTEAWDYMRDVFADGHLDLREFVSAGIACLASAQGGNESETHEKIQQESDSDDGIRNDTEEIVSELYAAFAEADPDDCGSITWEQLVATMTEQQREQMTTSNETALTCRVKPQGALAQHCGRLEIDTIRLCPSSRMFVTLAQGSKTVFCFSRWEQHSHHHGTTGMKITTRSSCMDAVISHRKNREKEASLLLATADGGISLHQLPRGTVESKGAWHNCIVCLHFDAHSCKAFAGDNCGAVTVWNPFELEKGPLATYDSHSDMVTGIECLHQSEAFASASMDGSVVVHRPLAAHSTVLKGHSKPVLCIRSVPDMGYLLTASMERTVVAFNPFVPRPLSVMKGHTSVPCDLQAIPETTLSVSIDTGGTLILWDLDKFQMVVSTSIRGAAEEFRCLAIDPTDYLLICKEKHLHCIKARGLKRYAMGSHMSTMNRPRFASLVGALFNACYGALLVCTATNAELRRASTMGRCREIGPFMSEASVVVLDDKHRRAIVGNASGAVQIFSCATGSLLATFDSGDAARGEITSVAYVRKQRAILSCDGWSSARMHFQDGATDNLSFGLSEATTCVDVNPHLDLIVAGTTNGELLCWRAANRRRMWRLPAFGAALNAICFASRHFLVAAADASGSLAILTMWEEQPSVLWRRDQGEQEEQSQATCLCWRIREVDGEKEGQPCPAICAGKEDGNIELFTCDDFSEGKASWRLYHTWQAHADMIVSIDCAEEADRLISASRDGRVFLWNTQGDFKGSLHSLNWDFPPLEGHLAVESKQLAHNFRDDSTNNSQERAFSPTSPTSADN